MSHYVKFQYGDNIRRVAIVLSPESPQQHLFQPLTSYSELLHVVQRLFPELASHILGNTLSILYVKTVASNPAPCASPSESSPREDEAMPRDSAPTSSHVYDDATLMQTLQEMLNKRQKIIRFVLKVGDADDEWNLISVEDHVTACDADEEFQLSPILSPIASRLNGEDNTSSASTTTAAAATADADASSSVSTTRQQSQQSEEPTEEDGTKRDPRNNLLADSQIEFVEKPLDAEYTEQTASLEPGEVRISHPNWLNTSSVSESAARLDEKELIVDEFKFYCSACQKLITGTRYKCLNCHSPQVHLCEACDFVNSKATTEYFNQQKQALPSSSAPSAAPSKQVIPHNSLHSFVRIQHADQCPDTGVLVRRSRNPFGVTIVQSIGVPIGSSVAVDERFYAGWKLRNDSDKSWVAGWKLRFILGEDLRVSKQDVVLLDGARGVLPGQTVEALMELRAPPIGSGHASRIARGSYRLCTSNGTLVGAPLDYEVTVIASKAPAATRAASTTSSSQKPVTQPIAGPGRVTTASATVPPVSNMAAAGATAINANATKPSFAAIAASATVSSPAATIVPAPTPATSATTAASSSSSSLTSSAARTRPVGPPRVPAVTHADGPRSAAPLVPVAPISNSAAAAAASSSSARSGGAPSPPSAAAAASGGGIDITPEEQALVYRGELDQLDSMGVGNRDANLKALISGQSVTQIVESTFYGAD